MAVTSPDLHRSVRSLPRRTMLQALLAAPLLAGGAGALGGCGGPGGANASPMASSTATREPTDPAKAQVAARAIGVLGGALLRTLAPEPPQANLLVSPYSIVAALTMAKLGAAGDTRAAMDATLGEDPRHGPLAAGMNALGHQLHSGAGEVRWGGQTVTIAWSEANSLWGQQGTPWEQPFLDSVARYFGGGMHQVDYVSNNEAARTGINAWTAENTAGKITEIIPAGMLNDMTRLVLVNAVHFKAPWASPFVEQLTQPGPFTRPDGSRVEVPMMHGGARGVTSGAGLPGFTAVGLDYAGSEFAFTAVLPERGREEAVHTLMAQGAGDITTGLHGSPDQVPGPTSEVYPARLAIPRFSLRYTAELTPALTELGMGLAFDAARADFSGMTTAERLFIAFVTHQATMDVDEEGAEAAAATAVGAEAASAPAKTLDVTLDRPFYVILSDRTTSTPLFLGYVADPTAS